MNGPNKKHHSYVPANVTDGRLVDTYPNRLQQYGKVKPYLAVATKIIKKDNGSYAIDSSATAEYGGASSLPMLKLRNGYPDI